MTSLNPKNKGLSMTISNPIAESKNFIVLDQYNREWEPTTTYQSESDLERELIQDLSNQGYDYLRELTSPGEMLSNVRIQLQNLNNVIFTDDEWKRFVLDYLDKPSDNIIEKTRKIQDDYVFDFVFDDGHIENIYLVDKDNVARNKVQVIRQFEQTGKHKNRYDVTILVNGLPLVQIELKKRGVAIREAFNQIHRYSKESFNSENSLYKYLQLFVISNGTDTRYFANTTKRDKNSFDFTMNWAKSDNTHIKDLKDFTVTFFQKNTLLNIIFKYSVFDTKNTLLVMRPYQIAATERILWKLNSSYLSKNWSDTESGGYIWHTTGSGKTLTSFKAARLATKLDFIDKVFFVVDRKDLDFQTMKEYKKFSPDSVNGSNSTSGLKKNLLSKDKKIVVTTIQKLNNLIKSEDKLDIYKKQVVFIFDEAHRSQFGEAQKNIQKKFKKYYQFGFTGTPIFQENASGSKVTSTVFGRELHSYVITDAIRDEKVLKFKVDYNDVRPEFRSQESEQDEQKISSAEYRQALLNPKRIKEISEYILHQYKRKTHRLIDNSKGFNAMFAVSSIEAARLYYSSFKDLQKGISDNKQLKIATIFSFSANQAQEAKGEILDEPLEIADLDKSDKEFLTSTIDDYNQMFKTNYSVDSKSFQNYYQDLSLRVKNKEIDLLIVVGMFLTGFDAPTLNTLFLDKNLRYHGLIQAFSRTNRIYDTTKTFGNIVTFRNLEENTKEAITLFGNSSTRSVILEKSFKEYMDGFTDIVTGKERRGYTEITSELKSRFPHPDNIVTEKDKKKFVKLFGEYLRLENILQNYDEYTALKELQLVDKTNEEEIEKFKIEHHIEDSDLESLSKIEVLPEREIQDYCSTYNDTMDWIQQQRDANKEEETTIDWSDVVFEVDLLKSQEINLDYILELIFEHNKNCKTKEDLIEEVRRIIRTSIGNRAKESLIVDFINDNDLDEITEKSNIIEAFFNYAQRRQKRDIIHLIKSEELNCEETKRYVLASLDRGYATENGTELNATLPKMSPLNPLYKKKKQKVFNKISKFVEKYSGVGGQI